MPLIKREKFIEDAVALTRRVLERELPEQREELLRDDEYVKIAAPLIADKWMKLRCVYQ